MKRKTAILIILIIITFLIIFLNYDNILKWRYNIAIKNKDCEKIYNIVDIEEGEYLTKEKYIEQCELKINDYNDYEIEIENHKIKNNIVNIYNNITFYIPSDSNFYLDNKLISNNFASDENNIYNIFTIDKLFEGEYSVKFKNQTNEEINTTIISENDLKQTYEYNNNKQSVVVVGYDSCCYCTNLLNFLSTLDNNIFDTKYYNIQVNNKEIERVSKEFSQYFKEDIKYYPTVIIGDKYITGFNETMEKEYIDSIYYSYRNEIETVIKQ